MRLDLTDRILLVSAGVLYTVGVFSFAYSLGMVDQSEKVKTGEYRFASSFRS